MSWKKVTVWFLIALSVALILYDIVATIAGYQYTITYVIRTMSEKSDAIPFALGVLIGYWLSLIKASIQADEKKNREAE